MWKGEQEAPKKCGQQEEFSCIQMFVCCLLLGIVVIGCQGNKQICWIERRKEKKEEGVGRRRCGEIKKESGKVIDVNQERKHERKRRKIEKSKKEKKENCLLRWISEKLR